MAWACGFTASKALEQKLMVWESSAWVVGEMSEVPWMTLRNRALLAFIFLFMMGKSAGDG